MPRYIENIVDYYFGVNEMRRWTSSSENRHKRLVSFLDWLGQSGFTGIQWFYLSKELPKMVAEENYIGAALSAGLIIPSLEAARYLYHSGMRVAGNVASKLAAQ